MSSTHERPPAPALSPEQQASLVGGADEWHTHTLADQGIPALRLSDGPSGLRVQTGGGDHLGLGTSQPATLFPAPCLMACSWDAGLMTALGQGLSAECRAAGVGLLLAPGVNIKRHPLGGRNFEYLAEDPCLAAGLGAALVQGLQAGGTGACVKHFAANNQEWRRLVINTVVDERTLREIYLAAFEGVIRQGRPAAVMAAYNRLNGTWCSEHGWLLQTVLREEWGFDGLVVSDWGGLHHRVPALLAGLDLEMPGSGAWRRNQLLAALSGGWHDEGDGTPHQSWPVAAVRTALERSAGRVAALARRHAVPAGERRQGASLAATSHSLARTLAARSMVLARNQPGPAGRPVLPLAPGTRVLLAGSLCADLPVQGAGSSRVQAGQTESLARELAGRGLELQVRASDAEVPPELLAWAELVLVCAGFPDGHDTEGLDRRGMALPAAQDRLIAGLASCGKPVVVAVFSGGPATLPWHDQVAACLLCYLPGQAGAGALADVLAGVVNPAGRLAETWPLGPQDCPADPWFPGQDRRVVYGEGPFVGYRGYRRQGRVVRFPFGHGLSYRGAALSGLRLLEPRQGPELPAGLAAGTGEGRGFHIRLALEARAAGSGPWAAREVVQLYVSPPAGSEHRPDLELRAFRALELPDQAGQALEFCLGPRDFAWWNPGCQAWQVDPGTHLVRVGTSSADLPLELAVCPPAGLYDHGGRRLPVGTGASGSGNHAGWRQELEQLVARQPAGDLGRPRRPFSLDSTLDDLSGTWLGRIITRAILALARRKAGVAPEHRDYAMLKASLLGMPLRNLVLMSRGELGMGQARGIIHLCNRRWGRAFRALREKTGPDRLRDPDGPGGR